MGETRTPTGDTTIFSRCMLLAVGGEIPARTPVCRSTRDALIAAICVRFRLVGGRRSAHPPHRRCAAAQRPDWAERRHRRQRDRSLEVGLSRAPCPIAAARRESDAAYPHERRDATP